jgi:uncharacterized protein YbjT (DUF2867 family)
VTDKKIIAVTGATGAQGGGLVRSILDDPDSPFAVRALTRNPDSPKARDYAARGAEVVRTDLDDEDGLRGAFDGAHGAFVVTNFWEQMTPEQETKRSRTEMEQEQAQHAARAVKAAGLRHVVWSTLEDTRPHFTYAGSEPPDIERDFKVPHFDAKAEANAYFTGLGVPTTFLETTFYYEAFLAGWGPHRDPNGDLELTLPIGDSVMALVAAEDIGRTAYGILKGGGRYIGRTVNLAGTNATGKELAEMFATGLGEPVAYRPMSYEQVRGAGFPFAGETANMFQFYVEAADSFVGQRDLDVVRALNPRLQPLPEWIGAHRDELKSLM